MTQENYPKASSWS